MKILIFGIMTSNSIKIEKIEDNRVVSYLLDTKTVTIILRQAKTIRSKLIEISQYINCIINNTQSYKIIQD